MAWQDILAGEVDVNSPITSSLMSKIKGNLDWLKSALVGWSVGNYWGVVSETVGTGWETIETIKVYIPNWAFKLHIEVKAKGSYAKFRLRDADSGATSDETAQVGSSYIWVSAEWQNPPSGLRKIEFQASGNGSDVYVAGLSIIVSEVS